MSKLRRLIIIISRLLLHNQCLNIFVVLFKNVTLSTFPLICEALPAYF